MNKVVFYNNLVDLIAKINDILSSHQIGNYKFYLAVNSLLLEIGRMDLTHSPYFNSRLAIVKSKLELLKIERTEKSKKKIYESLRKKTYLVVIDNLLEGLSIEIKGLGEEIKIGALLVRELLIRSFTLQVISPSEIKSIDQLWTDLQESGEFNDLILNIMSRFNTVESLVLLQQGLSKL